MAISSIPTQDEAAQSLWPPLWPPLWRPQDLRLGREYTPPLPSTTPGKLSVDSFSPSIPSGPSAGPVYTAPPASIPAAAQAASTDFHLPLIDQQIAMTSLMAKQTI